MSTVVVISGSPSRTSRTELLGDYVAQRLAEREWRVDHLRVRSLPAAAMLSADLAAPAIDAALRLVDQADGVVLATPTYKASYSGLLKAFLDLLPQCGFADKAVLPLATGGSLAHVLMLDYALRPVVHSLGARHVVQGFFLVDSDIHSVDGDVRMLSHTAETLDDVIEKFRKALVAM